MPIYTIAGQRVLFLHVPKTGGMAISAALQAAGAMCFDAPICIDRQVKFLPRHAPANVVAQIFTPEWFAYSFLIVRDPVQRAISEYRYQCRKSGFHLAGLIGFDAWLKISLARAARKSDFRDNHFRPQADYVWPGSRVFRYEDGLAAPLREISKITGIDLSANLSIKNVSPAIEITPSARSRLAIHAFYRRDFDQFGYPQDDA